MNLREYDQSGEIKCHVSGYLACEEPEIMKSGIPDRLKIGVPDYYLLIFCPKFTQISTKKAVGFGVGPQMDPPICVKRRVSGI